MAMNLPEQDSLGVSESTDSVTMSDTMGNPVTVPVASFMAVWSTAAEKWKRVRGVNGLVATTLFDASGNPVDTLDLLFREIRLMRKGMLDAGLIEDANDEDLEPALSLNGLA